VLGIEEDILRDSHVGVVGANAAGAWSFTVPSGALTSGEAVTADETKILVSGGFLETSMAYCLRHGRRFGRGGAFAPSTSSWSCRSRSSTSSS
jgi:hypothetical protein